MAAMAHTLQFPSGVFGRPGSAVQPSGVRAATAAAESAGALCLGRAEGCDRQTSRPLRLSLRPLRPLRPVLAGITVLGVIGASSKPRQQAHDRRLLQYLAVAPRTSRQASAAATEDCGVSSVSGGGSGGPVAWPSEVFGYGCRVVAAELPACGSGEPLGEVAALIVDDQVTESSGVQEDIPDWVPREWLSPVVGDDSVSDIYGAIGVWPAAFVAAELLLRCRVTRRAEDSWSCVEIGCGAGFPSLVAARLGASVCAVDSEQLPLELLRAAFEAQHRSGRFPASASLRVLRADASLDESESLSSELDEPLSSADVVVVSDLLYSDQLGRAVGRRLGSWLAAARGEGRILILTDGGRQGRGSFLQAFQEAYGSEVHFENVPVPVWAVQRTDFFDGAQTTSVGVLRY